MQRLLAKRYAINFLMTNLIAMTLAQGCRIVSNGELTITQTPSGTSANFVGTPMEPGDMGIVFSMVQTSVDIHIPEDNTVVNYDGTFRAFSTCSQEACELFVEDTNAQVVYELIGIPLPYRPYSDLHWISNDVLAFNRWSQPHYGFHYEVNVKNRELVSVAPITDQAP